MASHQPKINGNNTILKDASNFPFPINIHIITRSEFSFSLFFWRKYPFYDPY
jgi:hypothetical protein